MHQSSLSGLAEASEEVFCTRRFPGRWRRSVLRWQPLARLSIPIAVQPGNVEAHLAHVMILSGLRLRLGFLMVGGHPIGRQFSASL